MEGQGGGGGGGGGGGYGGADATAVFFPPPPLYNNHISTPPLSAIDRFLASHLEINTITHASQNRSNLPISNHNLEIPFSSYSPSNHHRPPRVGSSNYSNENQHPGVHEGMFDFFMTASQIDNWENSVGANGEQEMMRRTSDQNKRRVRGGYSSNIIKGQWSAEEDRFINIYFH